MDYGEDYKILRIDSIDVVFVSNCQCTSGNIGSLIKIYVSKASNIEKRNTEAKAKSKMVRTQADVDVRTYSGGMNICGTCTTPTVIPRVRGYSWIATVSLTQSIF